MVQIASIEKAIELYYTKINLSSDDVSELFGGIASGTVCKLKKLARVEMKNCGLPIWDSKHVNTEAAYRAWGIQIADLEKRYKKLKDLGFKGENKDAST